MLIENLNFIELPLRFIIYTHLYTLQVQKTCENFIKHCQSGYYNNTSMYIFFIINYYHFLETVSIFTHNLLKITLNSIKICLKIIIIIWRLSLTMHIIDGRFFCNCNNCDYTFKQNHVIASNFFLPL